MRLHAAGLTRSGAVLCLLCGLAPARATDGGKPPAPGDARRVAATTGSPDQLLDFDIPAQSLATALNHYAAGTGRPAVFRSSLVSGRTSSPVHGAHSPEAALRILLDGTGLVAADAGSPGIDAFVLKPAEATAAVAPGTSTPPSYEGLVQSTIWDAFCANPQTTPGNYRALLRFQVDATGAVEQAQLLGSTGDTRRDAAVLQTLRRARIDQAPPPGLTQPLIMLVLPRDKIVGRACTMGASP